MPFEAIAWLVAATALATGGVLSLTAARQERLWLAWAPLLFGLAAGMAGLAEHGARIGGWPAATHVGALACLGTGAPAVTGWMLLRWARWIQPDHRAVPAAAGLSLLGSALLLCVAGTLAWRVPAAVPVPGARSWLFGVLVVLASVGLGGWAVVFSGSAWGVWKAGRRGEFPSAAADAGRATALFAFPWLTAAVLLALLWNMAAHVSVLRATAGNLWLLASWLFGAAYLHATSAWHPLRLPAWLATALAGCVLAAGLMVALSAATML